MAFADVLNLLAPGNDPHPTIEYGDECGEYHVSMDLMNDVVLLYGPFDLDAPSKTMSVVRFANEHPAIFEQMRALDLIRIH